MNQKIFDDTYQHKLTQTPRNVLLLFLKNETGEHYHPAGIIYHLIDIAEEFDSSFKDKARADFREYLVKLFVRDKPELVNTEILEKHGFTIDYFKL